MLSLPAIVLRDHLVLCDADRLRVLNPTARRLWEIQRDTQDTARAVAWLVETYGLTVEQAERDVAALFAPDPAAEETPTTPALCATPPWPRRGKASPPLLGGQPAPMNPTIAFTTALLPCAALPLTWPAPSNHCSRICGGNSGGAMV